MFNSSVLVVDEANCNNSAVTYTSTMALVSDHIEKSANMKHKPIELFMVVAWVLGFAAGLQIEIP